MPQSFQTQSSISKCTAPRIPFPLLSNQHRLFLKLVSLLVHDTTVQEASQLSRYKTNCIQPTYVCNARKHLRLSVAMLSFSENRFAKSFSRLFTSAREAISEVGRRTETAPYAAISQFITSKAETDVDKSGPSDIEWPEGP